MKTKCADINTNHITNAIKSSATICLMVYTICKILCTELLKKKLTNKKKHTQKAGAKKKAHIEFSKRNSK